ncbi:MAG: alanine racemase [Thermodesulfobacteriota bacterium]
MRPTWAEIDLNSLKFNFSQTKKLIGAYVGIMPIVKADGYGHGAVPVSKTLNESCGTDVLGVATVEEALELRESGIKSPILLLAGIYPNEYESVLKNDLTPTIFSIANAYSLNDCAKKLGKKLKYHLKIDTGMSRLGLTINEISDFLNHALDFKNLEMEGLFTHFASADMEVGEFTFKQISVFKEIQSFLAKAGIKPKFLHLANSAAIQRFPESHMNIVRPGIMLYGSGIIQKSELKPVMKLKTKIIQLKKISAGVPVSYGGTFITKRSTVIATLPIGYADGYMRTLSNRSKVSINGHYAPVVGKVCMDLTMVDVTDVSGVKVGDEVTLFGDEKVSVDDVARWADTISYEILSITGKRVSRIYL